MERGKGRRAGREERDGLSGLGSGEGKREGEVGGKRGLRREEVGEVFLFT